MINNIVNERMENKENTMTEFIDNLIDESKTSFSKASIIGELGEKYGEDYDDLYCLLGDHFVELCNRIITEKDVIIEEMNKEALNMSRNHRKRINEISEKLQEARWRLEQLEK